MKLLARIISRQSASFGKEKESAVQIENLWTSNVGRAAQVVVGEQISALAYSEFI